MSNGLLNKVMEFGSRPFYLVLFSPVLLVFFAMVVSSTSPERKIIGEWKEISWEYEKVDKHYENGHLMPKTISDNIKQEILDNMAIHEAESWIFLPDGRLLLTDEESNTKRLGWKLNGRGHVLELKYDEKNGEHYKIQKIGDDELVIYFETDIQAKGIVKMTFKKV